MTIGLGIDSLFGGPDSTAWQFYQLEKFLVQLAQWVVCMMQAIVSEAVYDIEQSMNQQTLDGFNNAVQGVVQQVCVVLVLSCFLFRWCFVRAVFFLDMRAARSAHMSPPQHTAT